MKAATSGSIDKALINTAQPHLEMMALMIMRREGESEREIHARKALFLRFCK